MSDQTRTSVAREPSPGLWGRVALGAGRVLVGRRFGKALADLDRAQWLPPEELGRRSAAKLEALLRHAAERVPFYRDLCRERGIDPASLSTVADLRRLPVVDKAVFRAHPPEHFLADDVPPHRRVPYTTSGSTGDPFRFWLDRRALPLVFASHLFYDSWFGIRPLDRGVRIMGPPAAEPPVAKGAPLGFRLRHGLSTRLQRLYESLTQKRISLFDVDAARALEIHAEIAAFRPAWVLGYTSTLATIADELSRRGLRAGTDRPLRAVITIAETLTPERRSAIERYFGAPIANRYGQREIKYWCAQSCQESPLRFHVNTELVVWETLRQDGTPAAPGEVGRVVLTNLHNHAMPFIRYDTKDLAAVEPSACACGRGFPVVTRLDGRSQECLITPSGRMINPTSLGHYLFVVHDWVDRVRHYQLVQKAPDSVVLEVVPAEPLGDEQRQELERDLAELLGAGFRVAVEEVSEIPLERSGKRPIIKLCEGDPSHGNATVH